MQTIEREYTIKTINEGIENGNIVFNHPMQRKPGQWNDEQQSLLIHSILANFAVPQIMRYKCLMVIMIHFLYLMASRDLRRSTNT